MGNKKTWLTLVGIVSGITGSYWLAKAYRHAKTTWPTFQKRVYADRNELIAAFESFWRHPGDLRSLVTNPQLTHPFVDRIMLVVTGVNNCRYCSYAHARQAARQGLSSQEIDALLRGEIEHVPVHEAPALFFAQHYAEQRQRPDPDIVQRLVDTYGPRTAHDMITFIRLVSFANLVGNTFDALLSRLVGHPSPDTTLREELSVLAVFAFGIVPLIPALMLRAARAFYPSV